MKDKYLDKFKYTYYLSNMYNIYPNCSRFEQNLNLQNAKHTWTYMCHIYI